MQTNKTVLPGRNPSRMVGRSLGVLAGLALSAPVLADQSQVSWGGELFSDNCAECHMVPHDDEWFQARADAGNMADYDSLRTKVQGCANNFNMPWFDEEVDAVTAWMNETYYHFD